jgi:hypothetical protein
VASAAIFQVKLRPSLALFAIRRALLPGCLAQPAPQFGRNELAIPNCLLRAIPCRVS